MQEIVVSDRLNGSRARILDVAYDVFSRRGVRDVSLGEVIERSGVSAKSAERAPAMAEDLLAKSRI